jgi:hypothetical protein
MMMRVAVIFVGVFILAGICHAQPVGDARRGEQVRAAEGFAAANLREQVLKMPVGRNMAVGDLLKRPGGAEALARALQNAKEMGGTRWVDANTVQVQLEISGSQLADLLIADAREHPGQSPLSAAELTERLGDWGKLNFVAVGSSAGGEGIESARPGAGPWSGVDEGTRRRAIAAARADAMRKMLDGISDIAVTDTLRVGDCVARGKIVDALGVWFDAQPVTRVEFLDDLKVSVTVAVSPGSLSDAFRSAVTSDKEFSRDINVDWNRVGQEIMMRAGPAIGVGVVSPASTAISPVGLVLPISPPEWADTLIESEATGTEGSSPLKVARAAEGVAIGKLREKFLALRVGDMTLGEAVKADPRFAEAVNQVMLRAHTYKVDYRADGSVLVRVSLDLRNAWEELRGNQ